MRAARISRIVVTASVVAILALSGFFLLRPSQNPTTTQPALRAIVINEAIRTPLYLPLYHAIERGYFREAGVDARIVTGGTATASFAAMLSGEATFAQADPMYVPISREKGGRTKVVAQVVGRIALWGVARNPAISEMTTATVRGKKVATQPRPMSAYTYTVDLLSKLKLQPDSDVELITGTPGTEIAALLKGQADFMVSTEPLVSQAVTAGSHVVFSFPNALGDRAFSGLMAREDFIRANRPLVVATAHAYQRALDDIHSHRDLAMASARKYFPQIPDTVLSTAIERLAAEQVFPRSILISNQSWTSAIAARVSVGDLTHPVPIEAGCDLSVMQDGLK